MVLVSISPFLPHLHQFNSSVKSCQWLLVRHSSGEYKALRQVSRVALLNTLNGATIFIIWGLGLHQKKAKIRQAL
jgi:hypothetical protein